MAVPRSPCCVSCGGPLTPIKLKAYCLNVTCELYRMMQENCCGD